ncbi:hypothetical protein, partial [Pseudomonas syringae group genomosp. 7]|uniref:hypothetical protein n=1 Tax=Pseudomonas syringae group genomosp. 7 TaxID=251699 RepID=UPI00376F5D36
MGGVGGCVGCGFLVVCWGCWFWVWDVGVELWVGVLVFGGGWWCVGWVCGCFGVWGVWVGLVVGCVLWWCVCGWCWVCLCGVVFWGNWCGGCLCGSGG